MMYCIDYFQMLAMRFAKFLGTGNAMLYQTRAVGARICVEVDLLTEPVKDFQLKLGQCHTVWQEVMYEKPISYCTKCFKEVHKEALCLARMNGKETNDKDNGL